MLLLTHLSHHACTAIVPTHSSPQQPGAGYRNSSWTSCKPRSRISVWTLPQSWCPQSTPSVSCTDSRGYLAVGRPCPGRQPSSTAERARTLWNSNHDRRSRQERDRNEACWDTGVSSRLAPRSGWRRKWSSCWWAWVGGGYRSHAYLTRWWAWSGSREEAHRIQGARTRYTGTHARGHNTDRVYLQLPKKLHYIIIYIGNWS